MATIKIKYSDINNTPVSLNEGELAFSRLSDKLFIGADKGASIIELLTAGDFVDGEQLVEYLSDTQLYRAEAPEGSTTSDAVWRIRHITSSIDGTSATTKYADGSHAFDKKWDDRATYTYS